MDKDLLTIRWVTFVALVSSATVYLLPRISTDPAVMVIGGLLVLLAAGFLTWTLESSLRYLVRRLSPPAPNANGEEDQTAALRQYHSSTAHQGLPALLEELSDTLCSTAGADSALLWLPDGLPGGLRSEALLVLDPSGQASESRLLPDSLVSGIWQSVAASGRPMALENLASSEQQASMALLAVPLAWRDQAPVGLLLLTSPRPLELTDRQLLVVQLLAGEAALIVQNARLMVRVEYQAVLEERARLAREIHDGLAQTLAFLKIQAAQMQYYLRQGKLDRLEEALAASHQSLGDAYQDVRQAIDNLRSLPETSTMEWLSRIAHDFEAASGLEVDTSNINMERDLPPPVQAQLIRIIQEALSNVRRHARARRVLLSASEEGDELVIEVRDDGAGFDPGRADADSRYGLLGIRERASMIGAEIELESHPGGGTALRLHLPLGQREGS